MNNCDEWERALCNTDSSASLRDQFRALFELRNLGNELAVDIISKGFSTPSVLLKHELAYVLGQMKNAKAMDKLVQILEDEREDSMVRHEAGEALGAIGSTLAVDVLKKYKCHPLSVISETCELALERIARLNDESCTDHPSLASPPNCGYYSVDPAPAETLTTDVGVLEQRLLDSSLPLFDRYKAMFGLRNVSSTEAAMALTKGLKASSPLFRHEIAYVLGQIQDPATIDALADSLANDEMEMVRHECAEALGAIATEEAVKILEKYIDDENVVVRESCLIALDICDQENSLGYQTLPTVKQQKERSLENRVQ